MSRGLNRHSPVHLRGGGGGGYSANGGGDNNHTPTTFSPRRVNPSLGNSNNLANIGNNNFGGGGSVGYSSRRTPTGGGGGSSNNTMSPLMLNSGSRHGFSFPSEPVTFNAGGGGSNLPRSPTIAHHHHGGGGGGGGANNFFSVGSPSRNPFSPNQGNGGGGDFHFPPPLPASVNSSGHGSRTGHRRPQKFGLASAPTTVGARSKRARTERGAAALRVDVNHCCRGDRDSFIVFSDSSSDDDDNNDHRAAAANFSGRPNNADSTRQRQHNRSASSHGQTVTNGMLLSNCVSSARSRRSNSNNSRHMRLLLRQQRQLEPNESPVLLPAPAPRLRAKLPRQQLQQIFGGGGGGGGSSPGASNGGNRRRRAQQQQQQQHQVIFLSHDGGDGDDYSSDGDDDEYVIETFTLPVSQVAFIDAESMLENFTIELEHDDDD